MSDMTRMCLADVKEVATLEQENFARPWTREALESVIERAETIYLVAKQAEKIVGYVGMWMAADEGEITNVSVDKKFWGRKIGQELIEAIVKEGKKEGIQSFFLEVRPSNERALALYEKQGFTRLGKRKNFYEAPQEDAIVMCKR